MILLDTNVLSESGRAVPDGNVVAWFDRMDPATLHICVPVIAELSYGAERFLKRNGSKRYLISLELVLTEFRDRILPYEAQSARLAGRLIAHREAMGRPLDTSDAMIAAIAIAHGATLATRNTRDFEGLDLKLANPFETGA